MDQTHVTHTQQIYDNTPPGSPKVTWQLSRLLVHEPLCCAVVLARETLFVGLFVCLSLVVVGAYYLCTLCTYIKLCGAMCHVHISVQSQPTFVNTVSAVTHTHALTRANACTHARTRTHTHSHTHMHSLTHTHALTRAHTLIHTHTPLLQTPRYICIHKCEGGRKRTHIHTHFRFGNESRFFPFVSSLFAAFAVKLPNNPWPSLAKGRS